MIPENPQDSITFERVRYYTDSPRQLQPLRESLKIHEKGLEPATRAPSYNQPTDMDVEDNTAMAMNRIGRFRDRSTYMYPSNYNMSDPLRDQMLLTFTCNEKRVLACKNGNGCMLGFSVLDCRWEGWNVGAERGEMLQTRTLNGVKLSMEEAKNEEFEADNREDSLKMADIEFIEFIDVGSEILGLKHIQLNEESTLIGIRTRTSVTVIKVRNTDQRFKLKKVFELKSDEYWSLFSHVNFHKTTNGKISLVVVDVNAQFKVYTFGESKFEELLLPFESYYEPTDLSSFKSSCWLNDDRMILYSRIQIHELNFGTLDMKCRVTGGLQTVFLDLQPVPKMEGWFVLLTTREVILVNGTKGFKKTLAWKHSLNYDDKTMHLSLLLNPYNENDIMCVISSKDTNFNHMILMNPRELKVIDYPHWFFTSRKAMDSWVIEQIEGSNLYLMLQLTSLNELSSCILKCTSFYYNQDKYGEPNYQRVIKPEYLKFGQLKNEMFFHMISGDMNSIYSKLIDDVLNSSQSKESAQIAVQEYADRLSSRLAKFVNQVRSTTSFQLLADYVDDNVDMDELLDMITEFIDHFQRSNLFDFSYNKNTWKADMLTKFNTPINDIDALKDVYKEFLPLLEGTVNKEEIAKYIGLHLLLSTIVLQKRSLEKDPDEIDKLMEVNIKSLTKDQKEMFDMFESDMNIPAAFPEFDAIEEEETDKKKLVVDVPVITVSQSQKKRRSTPLVNSQSQVYTTNSSQAFSQQTPTIGSGSQKKSSKKKRRKTGF